MVRLVRRRWKRWERTVVCCLAVALFVLSACGRPAFIFAASSDGESAVGEPSFDGEILLGVSGPLTGDRAEYGHIWRSGFDLAIEEINARGGVRGKKLGYVFEDTQSDPRQTPAVARKFVLDDRIVAVIGDFSSPASMAASPIYQRGGLVQLGITNSHPDFTAAVDYIWSNSDSQDDSAPALAHLAVETLGHRRLAVIHQNTDWGNVTTDLFVDAARSLGADVVFREAYLVDEKDFRALLTKACNARPDALVLISYYNDGALISLQRQAAGLDVPVVAISSVYSPQFIALGGSAVEGVFTSTRFHPDDPRPEVRLFVASYKAKYGVEPDSFAAVAYDGVYIIAQALEAGGIGRKQLRDQLEVAEVFHTVQHGSKPFGPDRRIKNPTFITIVVRNGKFEIWQPE